jgi:decaprenylphospho-beta-D-ribofuranose 2-oxidase
MSWKTADYTGWGRALKANGQIARPERQAELDGLLREAPAPAIGMRRSYGDAATNSGGRVIDMTRLDRMLGFDPQSGLLEVESGVRIGDIATAFAPKGWLPPVMPGTGFASIGGCIAHDVHGKNHHHTGSFGQHIASICLMQGAKRIEVTPGSALFLATVGGLGQTGVILSARLKLAPCKGDVMMVTEQRAENWGEHLALLDASSATYCVGWIDATAGGAQLGRGIVEEAEIGAGLVKNRTGSFSVPMDAPHLALARPIVKAFNAAYYGRVPAHGRTLVKPIADFFFPLDKLHNWNRLYGKRGFHQFQCVVPLAAAPTLRAILQQVAQSGLASPLAVLKRMGSGRGGYLSFPMEGYTLAIDFPNRIGAQELIRKLEAQAVSVGGRIYFAKDSLSQGAEIGTMYPELELWQAEVAKADPQGHLLTDLVRRLKLRNAP